MGDKVTKSDLLPDWENAERRQIEIVTDPDDNFFVCADEDVHPGVKIRMFCHDECEQCSGSDDWGQDFCPVCDFCCGC